MHDKKNVLVVDDDDIVLDLLERLYKTEKYGVITAPDGEKALEILKGNNIDLIVSDLRMPGMNGIELIEKGHELNPFLASILITGEGTESDAVKAFTYGKADYYLKKPFNEKELMRFSLLAIKQMQNRRMEESFHEEIKKRVEKATVEIMEKNRLLKEKEAESRKLMERVNEEKEKIQDYTKKLERLNITDELTKVHNHRHFNQEIVEWFERAERYKTSLSLITLDIDDFKKVNDTYGHLSGDEVLRRLGEVLNREKRRVDITARCGGEEFSVLLPQIDVDGAKVVAERIRKAVEAQSLLLKGAHVKVTVSVGVATFPGKNVKTSKDLVRLADEAMYYAKNIGKNRVCIQTDRGLMALGEGETFTTEQKDKLRKSIIDFVSSHMALEEICSFLLMELYYFFSTDLKIFYGSVYTVHDKGHLQLVGSKGMKPRGIDIEEWARNAALTNSPMKTNVKDPSHPFSSLPIFTADKAGRKKTIAVLSIDKVPIDTEFLTGLLNAISVAVRDAIIREELDKNIQRNQQKVIELSIMNTTLMEINQMGMGAGRLDDIQIAEKLAKNLKYLTFSRIGALILDEGGNSLVPVGEYIDAKNSGRIKLEDINEISTIKKLALSSEVTEPKVITEKDRLTPDDKKLIDIFGIELPAAFMPMWNGEKCAGVFLFGRKEWDQDSIETLKNFFTHLALTVQNFRLASSLSDQNKRYDVLSDFCIKLNDVESMDTLHHTLEPDLREIGKLLNAGSVSIYSYDERLDSMEMIFSTNKDITKYHAVVKGKKSGIMAHVIKKFQKKGIKEPTVIKDVPGFLKRTARRKFQGEAYIGAPIFFGDELVGILNVTDLKEELLTEKDRQITSAFASILGITFQGIAKTRATAQLEGTRKRKTVKKRSPKKKNQKVKKKPVRKSAAKKVSKKKTVKRKTAKKKKRAMANR